MKDSDDEVPDLEEAQEGADGAGEIDMNRPGMSRGEKKTRKAMQKMGMKPVPGINRVTMKKSKNLLFAVNNPDVYKSASTDTYIVIGEAKIEDMSAQAAAQASQQFRQPAAPSIPAAGSTNAPKSTAIEDSDETGVNDKDIELVMGQAGCTRGQAVAALKNNDNDIVSAIMELTM